LDLIGNPFELLALDCAVIVVFLDQRVQEELLPDLLLLLLHLHRPNVLLKLTFLDAVLVFMVLERHLRLLLELRDLVQIVKD
jgi:hypothetical protein